MALRGTLRKPSFTTTSAGGGVATLIDHTWSASMSKILVNSDCRSPSDEAWITCCIRSCVSRDGDPTGGAMPPNAAAGFPNRPPFWYQRPYAMAKWDSPCTGTKLRGSTTGLNSLSPLQTVKSCSSAAFSAMKSARDRSRWMARTPTAAQSSTMNWAGPSPV